MAWLPLRAGSASSWLQGGLAGVPLSDLAEWSAYPVLQQGPCPAGYQLWQTDLRVPIGYQSSSLWSGTQASFPRSTHLLSSTKQSCPAVLQERPRCRPPTWPQQQKPHELSMTAMSLQFYSQQAYNTQVLTEWHPAMMPHQDLFRSLSVRACPTAWTHSIGPQQPAGHTLHHMELRV